MPIFTWGIPILSKRKGKYFKEKVPSSSTLFINFVCGNPPVKMVFDQRRMPRRTGLLLEKIACGVELTVRPSINRKASKNTKLPGVRVQCQQSFLFRS